MARRILVLTAAIALMIGVGVGSAFAFWSSHGTGSGTASTGTPAGVTVLAATGTPSTKLIPNTSADLTVTLDNPNSYAVTITGVAQNGTVTPVGGTGCTAANAGVSVATQSLLTVSVASGSGVVVHLANAVAMSSGSASGCQGASFQIPVTLTVQK
jgi:hypothetical protein